MVSILKKLSDTLPSHLNANTFMYGYVVCDGFAFKAMSIIIGKMIMSKTMLTIECFILINKQSLCSVEMHTISSLFSYFFPLFEWKCGFYSGCFLTSKNWSWFLRCITFNIKSINFDFNCSGYLKINMRLLKTISIFKKNASICSTAN